ncbi:MAG: M48 family metallopeptidase [bacterium]
MISVDEEIALGEEAFKQVLKEAKLSNDQEKKDLIQRVGNKLAAVADQPKYNWEFILIDEPNTVNAFALPGGKVAFYTGILPLCKDEAGIAVVMGHEFAHAIARHGAERMSQGMVAGLVGNALSAAVANKTPEAQRAVLDGYGLATNLGVLLPFSRKHEYEADRIGLILMAKAGYHPQAAPDFWKRMLQYSTGQKPPEFLSTHPNDEKRIQELEGHLSEAMQYYTK